MTVSPMLMYVSVQICIYLCLCMPLYASVCLYDVCVCLHMSVSASPHMYLPDVRPLYVCVYVCLPAGPYVCMPESMYAYMPVCWYVCVFGWDALYVCVYVCVCACMYVCMYV